MFEKAVGGLINKICEDCKEEHAMPEKTKICLGCMARRDKKTNA